MPNYTDPFHTAYPPENTYNINFNEYLKRNQSNSTNDLEKVNKNNISPENNESGNKKANGIKSILKRSSSLDNNSLTVVGTANPSVNFGLKSDKNVIKDSIEITNNRLSRPSSKMSNESYQKKSVRFATLLNYEDDKSKENNKENKEIKQPDSVATNEVSKNPQAPVQVIQNNDCK